MQKAMYNRATSLPAPIGIFIEADQQWKQLQAEHPQSQSKQKFYGLGLFSPTPSITTIQQLGLGIVHVFSTLILNCSTPPNLVNCPQQRSTSPTSHQTIMLMNNNNESTTQSQNE
jgi:hypothetical protein